LPQLPPSSCFQSRGSQSISRPLSQEASKPAAARPNPLFARLLPLPPWGGCASRGKVPARCRPRPRFWRFSSLEVLRHASFAGPRFASFVRQAASAIKLYPVIRSIMDPFACVPSPHCPSLSEYIVFRSPTQCRTASSFCDVLRSCPRAAPVFFRTFFTPHELCRCPRPNR